MNSNKAKIQLWSSTGVGIIISYPSGVIYSNQTGGTSCLHPECEGVYIHLADEYYKKGRGTASFEDELMSYFEGPKHLGTGATSGLDEEDADFVDKILKKMELSHCVQVDRKKLSKSHEAWVYVKILSDEKVDDENMSLFSGFGPYPKNGIFTWENSD